MLICFLVANSSRPGRPPKRGPVGLLPASHLSHHPQMKKHRMDNGDYPYENGHMNGEFCFTLFVFCGSNGVARAHQNAVLRPLNPINSFRGNM